MAELIPSATTSTTTPTASQEQGDVKVFLGIVSIFALCVIAFVVWVVHFRAKPQAEETVMDRHLVDFTLVERSGRVVTRSELAGKFLVVNFIHTSCSISCFQVNQRMSQIQERLAGQNDVQLVSISVDPQTDTPTVLTKFASQFRADANRWLFLTGEQRAVDSLLEASFILRAPDSPRSALFAATDRILIVDNTGRVRDQIKGLKFSTTDDVLASLERLRATGRR